MVSIKIAAPVNSSATSMLMSRARIVFNMVESFNRAAMVRMFNRTAAQARRVRITKKAVNPGDFSCELVLLERRVLPTALSVPGSIILY